MKRFLIVGIAVASFMIVGSLGLPSEAQAAVVQVRMTADVQVPYLVGRPPRPIIAPRRITMHVHREGVSHVRIFGMHHHHRTVRVGYHAPRFHVRTRLKPIHTTHPHFRIGHSGRHHDHGHGAKVKVKIGGPGHHRPGLGHHRPGHIGKPGLGKGGGKIGGKVKFKGKF